MNFLDFYVVYSDKYLGVQTPKIGQNMVFNVFLCKKAAKSSKQILGIYYHSNHKVISVKIPYIKVFSQFHNYKDNKTK